MQKNQQFIHLGNRIMSRLNETKDLNEEKIQQLAQTKVKQLPKIDIYKLYKFVIYCGICPSKKSYTLIQDNCTVKDLIKNDSTAQYTLQKMPPQHQRISIGNKHYLYSKIMNKTLKDLAAEVRIYQDAVNRLSIIHRERGGGGQIFFDFNSLKHQKTLKFYDAPPYKTRNICWNHFLRNINNILNLCDFYEVSRINESL